MEMGDDYMRREYVGIENLEYSKENEDKFKDENMYKYHENTQVFDPSTQPYSFFYVSVQG